MKIFLLIEIVISCGLSDDNRTMVNTKRLHIHKNGNTPNTELAGPCGGPEYLTNPT